MERQYVGVDLQRRRSVIHRMDAAGEKLGCVRSGNDPSQFAEAVSEAPTGSHASSKPPMAPTTGPSTSPCELRELRTSAGGRIRTAAG